MKELKIKKQIEKIDRNILNLSLILLILLLMFLFIVFFLFGSLINYKSVYESYTKLVDVKEKLNEQKLLNKSSEEKIEELKKLLPYAYISFQLNDIKRNLETKIDRFNKDNGMGITAKLENIVSNGMVPYAVATINVIKNDEYGSLVTLLYFEKIGYVEAFDGSKLTLFVGGESGKN